MSRCYLDANSGKPPGVDSRARARRGKLNAKTWSEISWSPGSPEVLAWRDGRVRATRCEPVASRLEYLKSLARDRRVLDVGVVEHHHSNEQTSNWLHRHLVEVAASCRGVDILEEGVAVLREKGYDVVCHDVTETPLEERFDVIIGGEIIEHLSNPGRLVASATEMLEPGGVLVLTTPNPYMIHRSWHAFRGHYLDSVDHAVLLSPGNIAELAERSGLELLAWRGVTLRTMPGWRNQLIARTRHLLGATVFSPEIECDTLMYELRRPQH